jgi:hypothetical protein
MIILLALSAGFVVGAGASFLCLKWKIQNLALELMLAKADLAAEKSRRQ